ncbi:hypothetical protein [Nannocystis pusilla]|uniref:hypothetical protein n=1 Tax=Nannocystis pusilla TaxID=889268 RepID=UPI003B762C25
MRRSLVICLLAACAAPAPTPTMPPPAPPPPATAAVPAMRTTLAANQRLPLGGGVTVHFNNVTVESIAASPDGSYPAGSGITLALVFEGMGAPVSREISLLSEGYESVREAWFDRYRVEVVEVLDPTRTPRLVVVAEQVTDRVRPGEARAVRVERGGEVELGSTRMRFLGHSTKHIDAGSRRRCWSRSSTSRCAPNRSASRRMSAPRPGRSDGAGAIICSRSRRTRSTRGCSFRSRGSSSSRRGADS